jgi:hypothetical protein
MAKLIAEAALGYQQVYECLLNHTSADNPLTIRQVHDKCPGAKGLQQVNDALRKYYKQGKVRKLREGRNIVYWWAGNTLSKEAEVHIRAEKEEIRKAEGLQASINQHAWHEVKHILPQTAPESTKPEILVTKHSVVINSSNVKITVEF